MKSSRASALMLCLLASPLFALAAEEATGSEPEPRLPQASSYTLSKGDQTISLGLCVQAPLFIFPNENSDSATSSLFYTGLYTGAACSLEYQYFLSGSFAIGGTVGGSFNQSYSGDSFFLAPLSFRTAYWWSVSTFEIGAALEAGGYLMSYNSQTFFGPVAKAGLEALWRINNAWSIGVRSYYWFVPELHSAEYSDLNRYGNFVEAGLMASYHI